MPYTDPEARRGYDREYKRLHRGGECLTPGQTLMPMSFRLRTAQDILELLGEQVAAVREEAEAGTLERARCIGYLAGVALRAVEVLDVAARLETLERVLKERKAAS